ncbi:MAG TPA: MarR family transcriptional regulator [Dermatophilaceae bacterium]|nr:MarR family transcriptional regulator [Dermatophilaceae bacterium]
MPRPPAPAPAATERIDRALLRTRRLWARPARRVAPGVDLSTVLVGEAVAEGASAVADVAAVLDVTPSTASRLVARAVEAGVVDAAACPDDHRRAALGLTRAGRVVVSDGRAFRRERLQALMAGWRAEEVEAFAGLLTRFSDALHDAPEPATHHLTRTHTTPNPNPAREHS